MKLMRLEWRAKKALKFLGVENIQMANIYVVGFDGVENLDLVKSIDQKLDEFKPTQIYTHNPIEVNIDHRLTYQAVETAARPKPGLSVKKNLLFRIHAVVIGRLTVLSNQTLMSTSRAFGRKSFLHGVVMRVKNVHFHFLDLIKGLKFWQIIGVCKVVSDWLRLSNCCAILRLSPKSLKSYLVMRDRL